MKCRTCGSDVGADSRFCPKCGNPVRSGDAVPFSQTRTIVGPEEKIRPGILFAGKYQIIGTVGRGGMGVVYKAEDTKLKRVVALKFLPPEFGLDEEARERFLREAQAAAALDHPNICTIYEAGESEGRTYIAMAFIEGRSLKEVLAGGPMEIPAARDVAAQVAEGLRAAHEKGVVHRDIKPGNIMVGDRGPVKIMDFGLARLEGAADLTRPMAVLGTVVYMSPEQARGEKVDNRTDIWSLGCTLYEMITGRRPFMSEREQAVIHSILHENPPAISSFRTGVPAELEDIVLKCLQKDPRNRYPDAGRLLENLAALSSRDRTAAAESSVRPPRKDALPSLAVLPFVDMSPLKDQEYFGDGIAEELINAFTRLQGLRVVARTSAFALKGANLDVRDIGRMLNVKHIVEGSVRKAGDRLRITAQLINVEDGYHLWSEKYDRTTDDIFFVQDEISSAIVEGLRLTLLAGEKTALKKRNTHDPEAYNLYLKGLYCNGRPNPESFQKALQFFREALDKDPTFAAAHAGVANIFGSLGVLNLAPPLEMFPKAKAALQKALDLDDSLAEAHFVSAMIAYFYEWDWDAAGRSFDRGLALSPGNAFAHGNRGFFYLNRLRFDDAVSEIKLALALDPLMPLFYAWAVAILTAVGRTDEALAYFSKAMEIDPRLGLAYFHAGIAYLRQGNIDKAVELLTKSQEYVVCPGWAQGNLAIISLQRGDRENAARIFDEMIEDRKKTNISATSIAWLAAHLGKFDLAFEYLEKAYEERDSLMAFIHVYTPWMAPQLRADPRYKVLLAKMKVSECP